ncbi:MAG: inositol monophosphatase [Kiritimatiellae bacterium]|nr:inositol monophosphatase [Kiritimatiellia bacterium]
MTRSIPKPDLLACAVKAARSAGLHAHANLHRRKEAAQIFKHDVKLNLDTECQRKAEDVIRQIYSDHAILGEEDTGADENTCPDGYEWIIDPIDGTVNFSHGLPFWCSSIAVRHNEKVLAGAIFAPELNQLFTATDDTRSLLNGTPISVSDVDSLDAAMITTGIDERVDIGLAPHTILRAIAMECQKVRVMGSAALDICRVAQGHADGYYETGIYLWDVAAAGLIVNQAGGQANILDHMNAPHRVNFMASNGHIQRDLEELVKSAADKALSAL